MSFPTPEIDALARSAVETAIAADGSLPICLHFGDDEFDVAALCAAHPDVGLLCPYCAGDHMREHILLEGTECAACRKKDCSVIHSVIADVSPFFIVTRNTYGEPGVYSDTVAVFALFVCGDCMPAGYQPHGPT